MNIIFLTRLFHPHIGGVEKHVFKLSQELIHHGHNITIITEQYSPELSLSDHLEKIQVLRIPITGVGEKSKKWLIWRWIHSHRHLLAAADVIHAHDVFYWLYLYRLLRLNQKIYVTFHGWEGVYPLPFRHIFHKQLAAFLSTGNICVGDYISLWYHIHPDFVTYGAVDLPFTPTSPKSAPPVLLFLGRLDSDTGFDHCVDLFRRFKSRLKWRLVIAGDGPLRHLAPRQAKLLGFVPDPLSYISQAKYVYTSGYLSILEAFAQGKIVLSSYSNPLKRDSLLLHPMSQYLVFKPPFPDHLPATPRAWAISQTWNRLAGLYLNLWSKFQS